MQSACVRLFFDKFAGNFIKKGLQHRLFPVKFGKLLRVRCFTENLQWLLLKVSGFQPATSLRKRLRKRCFAVNLAKFLRTFFSFHCFFCLSVNFETFLEHLGETAILCTSCRISTTRYRKNYFPGAFWAFYTRSRSSHSKALIYLKIQKTVCEGVNLLWRCEMPTSKLTKKTLSHILLHAFCFHFLRIHHNYFFQRGFESLRLQFLSGNVIGK